MFNGRFCFKISHAEIKETCSQCSFAKQHWSKTVDYYAQYIYIYIYIRKKDKKDEKIK